MKNFAYYLDFVMFPAAIAACITSDNASALSLQWISIVLLGMIGFTYVEYWVHRVVLHRLMWHGHHQRHHTHPEEYVTFPIWALPLGFAGLFAVTELVTGNAAFFVGVCLGYLWFIGWHHVLHHLDLRPWPRWVRSYATWHLKHHDGLPCNYGITHPLFDLLHGTYR